jgi:acyl-CoA reductase-like NAD-dependent aldehyde dehydrogenase
MAELLVVGGERVAAAEGKTLEVVEPGTPAPMAEVAEAGPEDARRAVTVASDAFEEGRWTRTSARERGCVLTKASFIIRERLEDLARLEARNGGKPITSARGEIDIVANASSTGAAPRTRSSARPSRSCHRASTSRFASRSACAC